MKGRSLVVDCDWGDRFVVRRDDGAIAGY